VSTHWIAASLNTRGRPRLPVPSSACQARSGDSQTARSPRAIRPRSYSRQFRVRSRVLGRPPCIAALLIHNYPQDFRNNASSFYDLSSRILEFRESFSLLRRSALLSLIDRFSRIKVTNSSSKSLCLSSCRIRSLTNRSLALMARS
jgi:hypothetical protein